MKRKNLLSRFYSWLKNITYQLWYRLKGGKLMQRESIDDTLLPDADELKKYKEIDPKVLDFILSRTSIEQDFRHQFNEKALAEQTTNNVLQINAV